MECPECDKELEYHDYFGRLCAHQDGKVLGDIYQCVNEGCARFQDHFYTYREGDGELNEGYPC
jgi:hypothetical protein